MQVRSIRGVAVAILCLLLAPSAAGAQAPATGVIAGRVTLESTGEPAHGVTVLVVGFRQVVTTDADGRFELREVPVGTWPLVAEREHFVQLRQSVTVTAGQTTTVTLALSLAGIHEELTVTGSATGARTTFDAFSAVTSLDSEALARTRGATIADSLASQPGIATRSFGPGSGRPIVRGFDGDRVLIMEDGVRTGDLSSQSGDHGVTIDPAGLDRLEVVKGPATLLYGSNAIGGVVNAVSVQDAFRASPFTGSVGSVTTDTGSANAQAGAGAQLQYGNGRWAVWAGGGSRRTGDYDTPLGPVANSASRLSTGRTGVAWVGARRFFSLAGQFDDGRFGIPFAGEFHGHEHGEEDEEEEGEAPEELDIDIASRRRTLRADAGLRGLQHAFVEGLKVTFNYTDYGHDEIEVEDGFEALGTRFSNNTATLRAELEQRRRGRLAGRMGLEWFGRDFEAVGEEALAPATTQSSVAAFVYEEMDFGRLRLQFGGRLERNAYDTTPRAVEEDHDEDEDPEHEAPAVRDRTFVGASGSLGLRADLGGGRAFVANVSAASRAPALEELYNFGPHVGNLAFEVGNPDLDLERTVGLDLSLRSRSDRFRAELNAFAYRVSNFVFLDLTGDEVDGLREALFLQGNSRFVGVEAAGSVDLDGGSHLHASVSYVHAELSTNEALPRIPSLAGRLELDVPWRQFTFTPEIVFNARQGRVFRDETPTSGSARLNLSASYLVVGGHNSHAVTVTAYNVTNATYRMHTSFIKDLAPEIGRGVRAAYTVRFF
ncbi:MAG TPA: TonB-dependent receptor [Vicinamibacterales bacterium]|nr:TonB-dependent receptor [Vicinamibacterales bacterium]